MIQIYRRWHYAWVWRFMISWNAGLSIGYYPDWENARWKIKVW